MKQDEKVRRFFNKINQEFFLGKNHLKSCIKIEQADSTSSWMSNLNNKWDNEIDRLTEDMSINKRTEILEKYEDTNRAMAEEWANLMKSKAQELIPDEPRPQYQKPVVIKGFC